VAVLRSTRIDDRSPSVDAAGDAPSDDATRRTLRSARPTARTSCAPSRESVCAGACIDAAFFTNGDERAASIDADPMDNAWLPARTPASADATRDRRAHADPCDRRDPISAPLDHGSSADDLRSAPDGAADHRFSET
jgi:hypothetical protein